MTQDLIPYIGCNHSLSCILDTGRISSATISLVKQYCKLVKQHVPKVQRTFSLCDARQPVSGITKHLIYIYNPVLKLIEWKYSTCTLLWCYWGSSDQEFWQLHSYIIKKLQNCLSSHQPTTCLVSWSQDAMRGSDSKVICTFYLKVAARSIVSTDLFLTNTLHIARKFSNRKQQQKKTIPKTTKTPTNRRQTTALAASTHSSDGHALGSLDQGDNLRLVGHSAPLVHRDDLLASHAACALLQDRGTRVCHTHCLGAGGWHCHWHTRHDHRLWRDATTRDAISFYNDHWQTGYRY